MPAPLESFLRYYVSGHGDLPITQEQYDHFGGDDILKAVQKYNPEAKWVDADIGGGEAGEYSKGKKLVFGGDGLIHLPTSQSGLDLTNMRPSNFGSAGLHNPDAVYQDENFGSITDAKNLKRKNEGIEKYAPYIAAAISMLAPVAAPALFGALGAGTVAAGATSAATAGAAGLAAGSTPGALGAGTFTAANAPGWASQAAKQATGLVRSTGSQASSGGFDLTSLLGTAASIAGIPGAGYAKAILPLIQMLQQQQAQGGNAQASPQMLALLQLLQGKR